MATIHIFNLELTQKAAERIQAAACNRARELAAQRNISIPARIRCGGDCSGWAYISYKSNAVRDCLTQALDEQHVKYVLDKDYSHARFQADLRQYLQVK